MKQSTKDRILSETPDEVKHIANSLVNKEETKCYCGHTTTCDCGTEEPKQETLEEVSERYANMQEDVSETIGKYLVKAVFKDGAYWNQERSYSEEEVILLLQKAVTHQDDGETGSLVTAQGKIRTANFYSWFEQFKKQ